MSKFTVKFDVPLAQRAEQAAQTAAKVVFSELNGRFQDAIGSKVWAWPRQTVRVNNKAVGSPRTIVDTGALRQSNSFGVSGYEAVFRWTVNYASFVHEGATIRPYGNPKAQLVNLPPRPWTSAVLGTERIAGIEPYDVQARFKEVWLQALKL
jgi:hypothetical protein